jgi:hypothetical protein
MKLLRVLSANGAHPFTCVSQKNCENVRRIQFVDTGVIVDVACAAQNENAPIRCYLLRALLAHDRAEHDRNWP